MNCSECGQSMTLAEPIQPEGFPTDSNLKALTGTVYARKHWMCTNKNCKQFQKPIYEGVEENG